MKVEHTVKVFSEKGNQITESNKPEHVVLVGTMHVAGKLSENPNEIVGGGLLGNAGVVDYIMKDHGLAAVGAYTLPELLEVLVGAVDCNLVDIMKVLSKHNKINDLHKAVDAADPFNQPSPVEESIEDLVMADAESIMVSAGILEEAAEPEVSPYQYWYEEAVYGNDEIVMYNDRLWVCSMVDGKMCTSSGTFYLADWKLIHDWNNEISYEINDHVLYDVVVHKRNNKTPKRSVNYAVFDIREWDRV